MRILQVLNINYIAKIHANELVRRGHTVAIYEPSLRGSSALLPVKLALIPGRVLDLRHIVAYLNVNHFDIVHIHWASYGVLGLVGRLPFIIHCHGSDVRYRLAQPIFRQMLTPLLQRAAAVLCVTPDILPIVRSIRSDAIFSPGPVDVEQFAPDENRLQHQPNSWTIMLFARLDPEKGTETAIQGIIRFADRHPGVHVKLLDHGPQRVEYRRRYGERFEFFPLVAPDEVPRLLQSVNVVVGQLAYGALGLSELQAMSCAKPLIASFRYEDAYPTPPPLCQATTAQEVDEHLEFLFQHPEVVMELGQREREWIITYHSHRALAFELEKLYQSILSRQH